MDFCWHRDEDDVAECSPERKRIAIAVEPAVHSHAEEPKEPKEPMEPMAPKEPMEPKEPKELAKKLVDDPGVWDFALPLCDTLCGGPRPPPVIPSSPVASVLCDEFVEIVATAKNSKGSKGSKRSKG